MDSWIRLVPIGLVVARVSGFFLVLPVLGNGVIPVVIRVGLMLTLSLFTLRVYHCPEELLAGGVHWMQMTVWMLQEGIVGLALGLAARLVFVAAQQGGFMISQQLGFADAGIIDPVTGAEADPMPQLMEMLFVLFFLSAGGHLLLVRLVIDSYQWLPMGGIADVSALAGGVLESGAMMLLLALKLAAPLLAAFLVLSTVLAVLARVLPEMNILFESYPLRVGAGLLLAGSLVPVLETLTGDATGWIASMMT